APVCPRPRRKRTRGRCHSKDQPVALAESPRWSLECGPHPLPPQTRGFDLTPDQRHVARSRRVEREPPCPLCTGARRNILHGIHSSPPPAIVVADLTDPVGNQCF